MLELLESKALFKVLVSDVVNLHPYNEEGGVLRNHALTRAAFETSPKILYSVEVKSAVDIPYGDIAAAKRTVQAGKSETVVRRVMATFVVGKRNGGGETAVNYWRFRVRGDVVEVMPAYLDEVGIRVEFFGDEIERISAFDPLTGNVSTTVDSYTINPAKQFVTPADKLQRAIVAIRHELEGQVEHFEKEQKFLEAQRIKMRTEYDLEMLKEIGFCGGIENYSRHLSGRQAGERPECLLDYFPGDFLTVIDESHVTLPQVRGMYNGMLLFLGRPVWDALGRVRLRPPFAVSCPVPPLAAADGISMGSRPTR